MRPRITATITNPVLAAMGRELFSLEKRAWGSAVASIGRRVQEWDQADQKANPWQHYARSVAGGYGAPAAGGAVGAAGGYGLGRALGFGQGGSALLGAGGAAAGGYLANRWQGGHFNQLMEPGGMSWGNLGKALWGGDK